MPKMGFLTAEHRCFFRNFMVFLAFFSCFFVVLARVSLVFWHAQFIVCTIWTYKRVLCMTYMYIGTKRVFALISSVWRVRVRHSSHGQCAFCGAKTCILSCSVCFFRFFLFCHPHAGPSRMRETKTKSALIAIFHQDLFLVTNFMKMNCSLKLVKFLERTVCSDALLNWKFERLSMCCCRGIVSKSWSFWELFD